MAEHDAAVLIVDDEQHICDILSRLVKSEGLRVLVSHDGDAALKMISSEMPDVLLVDFKMPGTDGMEVVKRAKEIDPDLPVVMITGYADIQGAVKAMRAGAHDYLAKPFEHHEVIRVLHRALAERNLKRRLTLLSGQLKAKSSLREMMGPSDVVGRVISEVARVAESNFSVVIVGETGSGKELIARAIHDASARSGHPFVAVDCGAIPETLFESELFGHEKGAFTGAQLQKPGKFQVGEGGTLFLDEISSMLLGSQAKLLRVLQEKRICRVGSTRPLKIDVRFLSASNKDLVAAVESGSFRRDLFYRLNEFTINVPPLRKRKEDIPYLSKRFLDTTNIELNKSVKGFTESALEALIAFDWPGNVRQLRSTIRRAVLLADDVVTEEHLDIKKVSAPVLSSPEVQAEPSWKSLSLKEIVRQNTASVEGKVLSEVLRHTGGNKAKAARLLQIDYKTIHTKIKQLQILIDGG